jgi:Fic family protein
MLFTPPVLDSHEEWVLRNVTELRQRLSSVVREPRRWLGVLRRVSFARAIQGSNSIEGYNVSLDDAVAAAEEEEPLDAERETWAAILGYRDAMTYVLQLADDPYVAVDESLIRGLHFMMLKYDLAKSPGRWRPGTIYVRNEATDAIVYEGPDAGEVPALVSELVTDLQKPSDDPVMIRAAMAHLNLVMIHPFRDGNGRMARCLQTLVLARDGILTPEFCSIEEYLGRNTEDYYKVLGDVGAGSWHPDRDTRPWIRFTLTAHYRQAQTLLRRVEDSEQRWAELEEIVGNAGLPERSVSVLFNASLGLRIRNLTYRGETGVSDQVASRDLRLLVDAGLLEPQGERRGRHYIRTPRLLELDNKIRARRPPKSLQDPFVLAATAVDQQRLWPAVTLNQQPDRARTAR